MIDSALRKLFLRLVAVVLFLLFMHVFPDDTISFIDMRFNLNDEANIPAWFSTILLFSVSISSFINYSLQQKLKNNEFGHLFWLGFGVVFCFLSADEAARIHEFMNYLTSIKWVFLYAPFGAILFMICAWYLFTVRKSDKILQNWIIGGLLVYATGGLGLEFISYMISLPPLLQLAEITLEEGCEMIGAIMVLMGCLHETLFLFTHQYSLTGAEK